VLDVARNMGRLGVVSRGRSEEGPDVRCCMQHDRNMGR
jgi:hypothetical protein